MATKHNFSLFLALISFYLTSSISSELGALWVLAATSNWVVRCEATHFAVAATSYSAVQMKWGHTHIRWGQMRRDEWHERSFMVATLIDGFKTHRFWTTGHETDKQTNRRTDGRAPSSFNADTLVVRFKICLSCIFWSDGIPERWRHSVSKWT